MLPMGYVPGVLELRKTPEFETWMKGIKNQDIEAAVLLSHRY